MESVNIKAIFKCISHSGPTCGSDRWQRSRAHGPVDRWGSSPPGAGAGSRKCDPSARRGKAFSLSRTVPTSRTAAAEPPQPGANICTLSIHSMHQFRL